MANRYNIIVFEQHPKVCRVSLERIYILYRKPVESSENKKSEIEFFEVNKSKK